MSRSSGGASFYLPGGAPFFFRGGPVGCLCLHGLQAVPQEVRWLGERLAAQGCTVYGPRLAGHGTSVADLRRTTWQDWYGSALDGYHILRGQCRRVFVLGLSLGGLLALYLAAQEQPDGVVSMASMLELDLPLLPYARYLKWLWRYTRKRRDAHFHRIDARLREIQARRGEPVIGRASYGQFPIASLAELYALMQVARPRLPALTAPLLLIHSEADRTVPVRNQALIAGLVGTPKEDLHTLRLRTCDHLLTLDVEMDTVFEAVTAFVARYAGQERPPASVAPGADGRARE